MVSWANKCQGFHTICRRANRSYNKEGSHPKMTAEEIERERDDPAHVIEARFQAALAEVKRTRRLSGDVRWDSPLARL